MFNDLLDQDTLVSALCAPKQLFPPPFPVWNVIFLGCQSQILDGDATSASAPTVKSRLGPESVNSQNSVGMVIPFLFSGLGAQTPGGKGEPGHLLHGIPCHGKFVFN